MSIYTPFDKHQIVEATLTETIGSWLIMRPGTRCFWARLTAADGLLTVTGDFHPTVFGYGPLDPEACIRWMGRQSPDDDYYPVQKASIGMGSYDRVTVLDAEQARRDLEQMIADIDDVDGDESYRDALKAGLDVPPDGSVERIIDAIVSRGSVPAEDLMDVGRKTLHSVKMAVMASARLMSLLDNDRAHDEDLRMVTP